MATVGPFEVWGFLGLRGRRWTVKKNSLARPSKENLSQMHDFGNFKCDWGDLWTFWSDFKMQNHKV